MKRLGIILLCVGFLLCAGHCSVAMLGAAQDRQAGAVGQVRVMVLVLTPSVDPNGALKALQVQAHIQHVTEDPSGLKDAKPLGSVNFDLLQNPGERVVVSGISREYRALALGIYAAAMQEWKDSSATPPPLDEERKTVRAK